MKINDSMQLEPWIAEGYELVDDLTWKITLKDGVCFSNGKDVYKRQLLTSPNVMHSCLDGEARLMQIMILTDCLPREAQITMDFTVMQKLISRWQMPA